MSDLLVLVALLWLYGQATDTEVPILNRPIMVEKECVYPSESLTLTPLPPRLSPPSSDSPWYMDHIVNTSYPLCLQSLSQCNRKVFDANQTSRALKKNQK